MSPEHTNQAFSTCSKWLLKLGLKVEPTLVGTVQLLSSSAVVLLFTVPVPFSDWPDGRVLSAFAAEWTQPQDLRGINQVLADADLPKLASFRSATLGISALLQSQATLGASSLTPVGVTPVGPHIDSRPSSTS